MSARLPIPPESKAGDSQSEIAACQAGFSIWNQSHWNLSIMKLASNPPSRSFWQSKGLAFWEINKMWALPEINSWIGFHTIACISDIFLATQEAAEQSKLHLILIWIFFTALTDCCIAANPGLCLTKFRIRREIYFSNMRVLCARVLVWLLWQ